MPIGTDRPRVDGLAKLTGRTKYVDDLAVPGLWHGGVVRSDVSRGRIKGIRFDSSIDWSRFVIVDHRDLPGPNVLKLIVNDQPVLAADRVMHKYEPVVLVASPDKAALRKALRGISVEIEPETPVLDPLMPLTSELIQYGSDNVFKRIDIRKGDPAGVFATAAHVVEGTYRTGAQEHVYLEPQGMLAYREGDTLTVQGSMQCPYYVVDALAHLFGIESCYAPHHSGRPSGVVDERGQVAIDRSARCPDRPTHLRVIQTPVGGGFGGKEEYPSVLAAHAALLSEKARAPVRIVYDRHEDMAVTTKRHPSVVRHRTALDADGHLLAMEIEAILDGGAYVTLSPVVLSRGVIHAAGPYRCENIHIIGEARLTNSPPYGAFRGFGAPQTYFAMERHMDVIARQIGLDPIELRRRNLLKPGETLATGQVFKDDVDLGALMDSALELSEYGRRSAAHAETNKTHPYIRRGIGLATFHHGSGFTGAGEVYLASEVWVEAHADGRVEVLTAQTDMGQGTSTILAQIAADALGLPDDRIVVAQPDTSRVPNSGPTVASRTAMVVGKLVYRACEDLKRRLNASDADSAALAAAIATWHVAHPGEALVGRAKYEKPADVQWDDKLYKGDAYASYGWAAHTAEVEIDLRTFGIRVTDYVALQEIGRVLNPTLARGQIQGGVVQGIGWALMEEVVLDDGVMKNAQMTNYIIPGSGDLPPIRVYFEERPTKHGPGGAKGIGELPMDGPAPAVINAVCNALGISASEIPLTPERLMALLEERCDG
ncbi:MAG: xanthine dehydrogenase family protein [Phycisphaerales bacterium]|nr:xanthine dehydrogenase family protein [Phycisphaerales bacterium]